MALDARVVALVAEVERGGSLAAAARALAIPYRTAWARIDQAERALGAPLVELERGVGAKPAALGRKLLAAHAQAGRWIAEQRDALAIDLGGARARPDAPLRVAASHDLVLGELRELWARRHRIALEFHGSAEALDLYRAGRADAAGFHVALQMTESWKMGSDSNFAFPELGELGELGSDSNFAWKAKFESDPNSPNSPNSGKAKFESDPIFHDPLLARLDPARDAVLPFVVRAQGFILPTGNPAGVRSFADVARRRLRFVNRQPGSGTRIAIERLLAQAGVDPEAIVGWTNEEFTHAAVAATIAAGRADAGFGIRAAAAQLKLAFVPVVDERYAFAIRRDALADPRIRTFRRLLASEAVAKVVTPMPGYRLDAGRAVGKPASGASASRADDP